jgi:VIT1/CCC1 family predicted Fe2+/Mn2+ transporter
MQDGMVSTLGALTGIAIGSENHFVIILSGLVIIAVESISMGVGSYVSSLSEQDIKKRKIAEERSEIEDNMEQEEKELVTMYQNEGWPTDVAKIMAHTAANDRDLMLTEMTYRELRITPNDEQNPIKNGVYMFFAYIAGGGIPLLPYFFFPVKTGVPISITVTLLGLFGLGVFVTTLTRQSWIAMGVRMLILGGAALIAGYYIGKFASLIPMHLM